jgi:hypothetical protein
MRVLGTSIPKSGTNLLYHAFQKLGFDVEIARKAEGIAKLTAALHAKPDSPDRYIRCHWRVQDDVVEAVLAAGYKIVVLIRDPRDICLSMTDFLLSGRPRPLIAQEPSLPRMSRDEILEKMICGATLPNYRFEHVRTVCAGWLEWKKYGALIWRYEDLEEAVRLRTPVSEAAVLGLDPEKFLDALVSVFGNKSLENVNTASVARWKREFDRKTIDLWNENARGLATTFGFEECD